jgi:hypothetical protein
LEINAANHYVKGKAMNSYVVYIRTAQGEIIRSRHINLRADTSIEPYIYEEKIVGWPETTVFWDKKEGDCVGLAPTDSSSINQ